MGRRCLCCSHPRRPDIDAALAAGASYAGIARDYPGISADSAEGHAKNHLAAVIAAVPQETRAAIRVVMQERIEGALDVRGILESQSRLLLELITLAHRKLVDPTTGALGSVEDPEAVFGAQLLARWLPQMRSVLALATRVLGLEAEGDLASHPEWAQVTNAIVGALDPHPEARAAVVAALARYEPQEPAA